jgi:hypothetical protein
VVVVCAGGCIVELIGTISAVAHVQTVASAEATFDEAGGGPINKGGNLANFTTDPSLSHEDDAVLMLLSDDSITVAAGFRFRIGHGTRKESVRRSANAV